MSDKINFLFISEVAERLRMAEATVRWLRHNGDLPPAAKIGKRLVWRDTDIEAYIEAKFAKAEAGSFEEDDDDD